MGGEYDKACSGPSPPTSADSLVVQADVPTVGPATGVIVTQAGVSPRAPFPAVLLRRLYPTLVDLQLHWN